MSEAAAMPAPQAPKKSRLGLWIALLAVTLIAGGGAGAWWMMSAPVDEATQRAKAEEKRRRDRVFVTLDPFVVNLADRDQERYAQVGVVLELDGKDASQRISEHMPVVRNAVLLLISSKRADDLIPREGKERLADEIRGAAAKAIGWKAPAAAETTKSAAVKPAATPPAAAAPAASAQRPPEGPPMPVSGVHFASFIVQ